MTSQTDELPPRGAVELLERLYARRATGELLLRNAEREDRLFLLSGELYLAGDDPHAPLAEVARGGTPDPQALDPLVERIVAWDAGEFELTEGIARIGSDARGPMPTGAILMDAAVSGLDAFQLLRRLGGEDRSFLSTEAVRDRAEMPELDPSEAFLLSRMERPVQIRELLRQGDQERDEILRRLCRLLAVALIIPADRAAEVAEAPVLSPELARTFENRVAETLEREPLGLDADEHRARLGDLVQRLGEMTHYDLLGLGLSPTAEELHEAYLELARQVHPSNAPRIGLKGREAAMRLLFERATEAYLVLSDSERTRKYLAQVGSRVAGAQGAPTGEARVEESRGVAERYFRMARGMADREEYHFAIELLHQAIRNEPRAEFYALLGTCQVRNPNWLTKAVFSYSQAVQLDPQNADLRAALAGAYEQAGNRGRAREEYQAALDLSPAHHEALDGLQRLRAIRSQRLRRPSALRRFVEWLRG